MKNKKMLLGIAALILVVALMLVVYTLNRPETTPGAKTITVTVVHGDGTSKDFVYNTDEENLGPVLLAEELVTGYMGQYGLVIESVDGEAASWEENQSYWALYVGEEYAVTGADTTPIADGDTFKLVYTIG